MVTQYSHVWFYLRCPCWCNLDDDDGHGRWRPGLCNAGAEFEVMDASTATEEARCDYMLAHGRQHDYGLNALCYVPDRTKILAYYKAVNRGSKSFNEAEM